ncbi:hypothetical protein ACIQBJ_29330 [Kitasatospora sp. NPDC088391]|uniref:hypothetical protein n=1 Tax=Kitasatospora sp. NPDC088391 TaxID=3364074 RepID=UPI0038301912
MPRRTAPRVYREVDPGPTKAEKNAPPPGWTPLDDYRQAKAEGTAPSLGSEIQKSAVLSSCTCPSCRVRQGAV